MDVLDGRRANVYAFPAIRHFLLIFVGPERLPFQRWGQDAIPFPNPQETASLLNPRQPQYRNTMNA